MALQATDTLRAVSAAADTARLPTSVESPLPGGVAEVVRFLFNVPQWIQIGGFFLGIAVALWVAWQLWRRRGAIAGWVRTRQRGVQLGLAIGLFGAIALAGGAGMASWNYMQHDNGFCTGCHVMAEPFGQFTARAGKHDSLQCHDCHQQPITASIRQLYLWVAERPQEIGDHAKVPTAVCAQCHVKEGGERWERIATTAGHRTHLESDSSALAGIQCVTCHGEEVHRFVPVDRTCGQSGCHEAEKTGIVLGKMAQQTSLHCVTCHQFTAEVPRLATRDSAAGTLRPANEQCLSCHEMRQVLAEFDPTLDPHGGTCGMCHNPHEQATPAEAARTCAMAGCHDNWRNEPFHQGLAHRRVGQECVICHEPHRARLDASDCNACHERVRSAGRRLRVPPPPFDTLRALRRSATAPHGGDPVVTGFLGGGLEWQMPPPRPSLPAAQPDSFSHPQHRKLACLTCHATTGGHGRLTFEPPRGCQICHHQAPATSDCTSCHRAEELRTALAATLTVHVGREPPRTRTVAFDHRAHTRATCITCHVAAVTLTVAPAVGNCTACHDEHHAAARGCAACHAGSDWRKAHARPAEGHRDCDACHEPATIERLVPNRAFCLTCHEAQTDHYPTRECTVCHFLATPEQYRRHLKRGSEPR